MKSISQDVLRNLLEEISLEMGLTAPQACLFIWLGRVKRTGILYVAFTPKFVVTVTFYLPNWVTSALFSLVNRPVTTSRPIQMVLKSDQKRQKTHVNWK